MRKGKSLYFIKQYKIQFIGAFINSLVPVLMYTLYKSAFVISRLRFDLFPELPWEERAPLIEKAKSEQIVKTIIVSIVIILIVYFPLLLMRFKIDLNEKFFESVKRYKEKAVENDHKG